MVHKMLHHEFFKARVPLFGQNWTYFYLNKLGKSLLFNHVLMKTYFRKSMTLWGWLLKHLLTNQEFTVLIFQAKKVWIDSTYREIIYSKRTFNFLFKFIKKKNFKVILIQKKRRECQKEGKNVLFKVRVIQNNLLI